MPNHFVARILYFFVLFASRILFPEASHAAVVISSCGATCSTNCELGNHLACDETTPVAVQLVNGATLDLKGFNIKCVYQDGDPETCHTAIEAGAGSVVYTSVPAIPNQNKLNRIGGSWRNGIICLGAGTRVSDLSLRGFFGDNAIRSCQTIERNSIVGIPSLTRSSSTTSSLSFPPYGILARTGAGSNVITSNYFDGFYINVYRQNGGTGTLTIAHNTFNVRQKLPGVAQQAAIELTMTADHPVTLTDNIFTGDSTAQLISVNPAHAPFTYSNNICKRMPACGQCVAAGQCQASGTCHAP